MCVVCVKTKQHSSVESESESQATSQCRLSREQVPDSHGAAFVLVATNDSPFSLRATLEVSATNAVVSIAGEEVARDTVVELSQLVFACPKQRKKILFRIAYLDATKGMRWTYKAHLSIDSDPKAIDHDFQYSFPVKDPQISQGNCEGSHVGLQSRFAFDFLTDIGTEVFAARSGIVIAAVDSHPTDGAEPNKVVIVHSDESVGVYGHLANKGVFVEPGDHVEEGQKIALSGNSGASSGPHLHFHVAICNVTLGWVGIKISFRGQSLGNSEKSSTTAPSIFY